MSQTTNDRNGENDTPLNGSTSHFPNPFLEIGKKLLKPFASLQVTIVLFVLSIVLVFFGTLAQQEEGIWTVVEKYFYSGIVWVPTKLISNFLITFFNLHPDTIWAGKFPLPGGALLGGALLTNLLSAHLMRFRLTWKRSGILVIHSGMVLLMVGELITRECAIESTITLQKGETSNFIDETLTAELVIFKPRDEASNDVIKIPQRYLKKPGVISHPDLPVDIEIVEYWKNSDLDLRSGPPADPTWSSGGGGEFSYKLVNRPEEAGVEQNQRGDATSVRVNLRKKGTQESIGKHLLSLWYYSNSPLNSRNFPIPPTTFSIDGKDYTIELRNKRQYLPYALHLKNFEHDKYKGTDMAKDFASTVDVVNPAEGDNREARIWMNNPLRYMGKSFYQLSVLRGDSGTVLQVVENPGRLLPYLSCFLVSMGMMLHFGLNFNMFLRRKKPQTAAANTEMTVGLERYLPIAVVVLSALWIVSKAWIPSTKPDQIDYYDAGQIPVLHNGRFKPLDTVAQSTLQAISGRTEVQDENKKIVASAMQWYMDLYDSREPFQGKASEYKIFRIDNDAVLGMMKLKPRPEFFRYSAKELEPQYKLFEVELEKVQEKQRKNKKLDLRDTKIMDLGKKLKLYSELFKGTTPHLVPPQEEKEEWQTIESIDKNVTYTRDEIDEVERRCAEILVDILKQQGIKPSDLSEEEKIRYGNRIRDLAQLRLYMDEAPKHRDRVSPAAGQLTEAMNRGKERNVAEFKEALAKYRNEYLKRLTPDEMADIKFETFLNHFAPFYLCSELYVMVIILTCLAWLAWREPLNQSAFWLAALTLVLHTFALLSRMYLQGRPPVTNLYSSAIFIGWACVILCMLMELYYRNGIGNILGGTLGALTMMMAHFLSEGGDTMELQVAVLDTNFWLATHVTIVTLGYMATFVAGAIGVLYIGRGVFTQTIDDKANKMLGGMMYGTICFATLLSFTGTVLGGLWADYSWGRFWGWDAKENGAVMVVIWNTLIIHARWCGLIKIRGMAVLALVGSMVTFWSWFGTNQLGAGLHNYGFNSELAQRCRWFWMAHIGMILVGLLPLQFWRSFSDDVIRERALAARRELEARKRKGPTITGQG